MQQEEHDMTVEAQCLRCGSTKLEPGVLQSAHFRPDNITFLNLETSVQVRANICLDCGRIELMGDSPKVKRLIGRGDEGA